MFTFEDAKGAAERLTGIGRPTRLQVQSAVMTRKPNVFHFTDDGHTPNNSRLPLIVYRGAVRLAGDFDPAAILEELFKSNGWADGWRDGIYNYNHYHSRIHEVLGIARGKVYVRFGGSGGRILNLKAGDVAILPAGTGHMSLTCSNDLLVVGAYPAADEYDECRPDNDQHDRALRTIAAVPLPKKDPVYGREGPLTQLWK